MPIPTSDLQKQVKAPNVSQGKAVNFSEQAAAPILNIQKEIDATGNLLEKGISLAILQSQDAKRRASDTAAKQAFNDYEVAKDDLNTQLQSLEGQDAVDFYYGDYTKKINEAHQKLTAVLDSLPNKDIAQNYRDKVNQINMQNRGFSFLTAKRQENAVRDSDHKAYIQNLSMEHLNDMVTAPEGVNRYDYAARNAYNDINRENTKYLASRGLATPNMIKAVNEEAMTKFAGEMVRNVANAADWDGSKTGEVYQNEILPAVKSLQKYVSPKVYQDLLEHYAGEAIRTDASLRPNDFVDPKTGEVKKDFLNNNYYGLTPWQKTQILSAVRTSLNGSHNSSLTAAEAQEKNDILDREVKHLSDEMGDLGLETNADYRMLQFQGNLSKEEITNLKAQAIKKFDLSKATDLLNRMDKFRHTPITLTTGKEVLQDDDRVRKMYNDLYRFAEIYVREYQGQMKKTPGIWGFIKDNLVGSNPSVKQAAMSDLIESQALQYRGSNVGAEKILDALLYMDSKMSLDPSVNWNAPADSREGFYNPIVLDKVETWGVLGLGEPGGQFEVYRNSGIDNMESLVSKGVPIDQYQNAYMQMLNRANSHFDNAMYAASMAGMPGEGLLPNRIETPYQRMVKNRQENLAIFGTKNPDLRKNYYNNMFSNDYTKRNNTSLLDLDSEILKTVEGFNRRIAEKDLEAREQEQKEIDKFNGGYK